MNKFNLGKNASISLLIDIYPDAVFYADNDPIQTVGRGIAIIIETKEDLKEQKERIEIVMDKKQAKAVIKGLKMQIRNFH